MVGFSSQWIPVHLWWCSSNWFLGSFQPSGFFAGWKGRQFQGAAPLSLPGNLPLDGPLRFSLQGVFSLFPWAWSLESVFIGTIARETPVSGATMSQKIHRLVSSEWTNKKEGSEYLAMNKRQPPGIINPSILPVNDFDSKLFYPLKLVRICKMYLQ